MERTRRTALEALRSWKALVVRAQSALSCWMPQAVLRTGPPTVQYFDLIGDAYAPLLLCGVCYSAVVRDPCIGRPALMQVRDTLQSRTSSTVCGVLYYGVVNK